VEDNPELDCKELVNGIEVGVLRLGIALIPLDNDVRDGVPTDVLLLLGPAERLDGAELAN
jgi:hypothetical protein